MASDQDPSQKTEDPTQKRLDEAKKKGDIPKSQDVPAVFSLVGATIALAFLVPPVFGKLQQFLYVFFASPHAMTVDGPSLVALYGHIIQAVLLTVAPLFAILIVFALAGHLVQAKPRISAEKIKPSLNKINPISGVKKILGKQALVNLAKGVAKMTLVAFLIFLTVWPARDRLLDVIEMDPSLLLPLVKSYIVKAMIPVIFALIVIAVLDYVYQRMEFFNRQKMSKQEVKDEHKQTEGDPHVKAKIRSLRMERSRQRMMAAVPDATVVVANPTHFAVALKYDQGQAGAPLCVAKGVDAVALKIRETAETAGVPVVENPPLARALYAVVDLDQEIPEEHYKAVAKVISYVFRTARGRRR